MAKTAKGTVGTTARGTQPVVTRQRKARFEEFEPWPCRRFHGGSEKLTMGRARCWLRGPQADLGRRISTGMWAHACATGAFFLV